MIQRIVLCLVITALAFTTALAGSSTQSSQPATSSSAAKDPSPTRSSSTSAPSTMKLTMQRFGLEDGTPVKLRTARTISSADAHTGDTLEFEVLEDVMAEDRIVIQRGALALGTVTDAEPKRRMGRAGKLAVNIDSVQLSDGEKAVDAR